MNAAALLGRFTACENAGTVPVPTLFDTLREESASQVELAAEFEVSRKTINRLINECIELGLVREVSSGYRLTGAGAIALHQYTEAVTQIGEETLGFLANSQNRVEVLQAIQEQPARKATLASRPRLPSRATVGRTIDASKDHGLIDRSQHGVYSLSLRGKTALESYDELMQAFGQVLKQTPCLKNLGVECADLPVKSLQNERLVVGTPVKPLTQVNALIEYLESLDATEIDHVRTFSSYFDLRISRAFAPIMQSDTRVDIVSPASTLQQIPTASEAAKHVKQGLGAEHVRWYLYPGILPAGLMVIDERCAIVGPRSVSDATEVSGTVYCSDPELIQWAIDLHDTYCSESQEPLEYLLGRFRTVSTDLVDRISQKPLS